MFTARRASPISPEEYKHGYRDPYTYRPWKMEGYMLGVDPYGRPIFKVNGEQVGGGVVEPPTRPASRTSCQRTGGHI